MSYEAEQDQWLRGNNISIGSLVTVEFMASSGERGWCTSWVPEMDSWVGCACYVMEVSKTEGILLERRKMGNAYWFPWFALSPGGVDIKERVYRVYPQIASRGITDIEAAILLSIDSNTLSHDQIEQILALFDEGKGGLE